MKGLSNKGSFLLRQPLIVKCKFQSLLFYVHAIVPNLVLTGFMRFIGQQKWFKKRLETITPYSPAESDMDIIQFAQVMLP